MTARHAGRRGPGRLFPGRRQPADRITGLAADPYPERTALYRIPGLDGGPGIVIPPAWIADRQDEADIQADGQDTENRTVAA